LSSISWSVNFLLSLKRSRIIPNPLSLRLPALGYGAPPVVWNAADLRGTRDGPAALVTPKVALLGAIEARGRFATGGAIFSGASFGGAGLGAEKCILGAGRVVSARNASQWDANTSTPALPCSLTTGLFSIFRVRTAKLRIINNCGEWIRKSIYFRVFKVSCRNLSPGARLQIRRPMDEPPNASWRIRVNLELR